MDGDGGDDVIRGGLGRDQLFGGTGADIFVFDTYAPGLVNTDQIIDFLGSTGIGSEGDEIWISQSAYKLGNAFNNPGLGTDWSINESQLTVNQTGRAANTSEAQFIYNKANGDFFYDSDGGGAQQSIKIAVIGVPSQTRPDLVFSDIHIF